jgi:predicted nicotinamide N-methyase
MDCGPALASSAPRPPSHIAPHTRSAHMPCARPSRMLSAESVRNAGRVLVELGAGSGLVGITAARLGAHALITDLGAVLPTLRANVAANIPGSVATKSAASGRNCLGEDCTAAVTCAGSATVHELYWGQPLPTEVTGFLADHAGAAAAADLIVASDVVYLVQILPELARTIADLSGPSTRVVLVNEHRWSDVDGCEWPCAPPSSGGCLPGTQPFWRPVCRFLCACTSLHGVVV